MTDPISYSNATARLGLPLLFAGQAQKETTVNEALALLDLCVAGSVQGVLSDPPTAPAAGQAWIVGISPTGAFTGHANAIAGWTEGGWRFVQPSIGMRSYDVQKGAFRLFDGGWTLAAAPDSPQGGAIVDAEARAAIGALIELLKVTGTISDN
ncbi:DUF2793 domain-containing protein [Novosphingobium sp. ERW19]|uniref:DUF2793 domain-containing protein n=1 Tax=Novosphingobium sp. ERW19 TaxID=2726186 RepID=UPI0014578CF8|nr:DUF2793 domain-containing protein [Novosphingobium sp. ERW19]NLR37878.1 DUF2793 domain-containing protein [Novosphingobium sp. ERW19]